MISGNGGAQIGEGRHYSIVTGKYTLLKSIKTIANKTLYVGKCYQLKVTKTPSNATETLKYTSSNKKVATVSSNGKITAKAKGTATITMVSEHTGIKKSVKITVKEIAVLKVQITTSPKSIYVGKQLKLSATVTPTDATNSKIDRKSVV